MFLVFWMWLTFRHAASRTGEGNFTFSKLVPYFFALRSLQKKKKKEFSNYCSNQNQIKSQMLLLFHSCHFPFFLLLHVHAPTPPTVKTPLKTLHTTEVYLGHVIFVLLKISSRAHEIISCAHEMIYCELSFQRQMHVT